jgi:hypothetical protein
VNSTDAANPRSTQPAAKTSDVISAKTFNVASADPPATERAAQTSDAPPAETANMPSTEAADPASANPAAHSPDVTPTKTPAMASSALGLRRGYRDATGKCRGGQNHHQPFQHGMFLLAFDVAQDRSERGCRVGGHVTSLGVRPARATKMLTNAAMRMLCLLHSLLRGIQE